MFHFVNCTSSPEPVAESLADSFSAMCQSAPLSWRNTLGLSSSSDNGTDSCPGSQSGTMFSPSTESTGEDGSMLSAEASPARTSAPRVEGPDSTENGLGFGLKWLGSFARFDPASSSWKTVQCSLLEGLDGFSETWPRWGSMRNGVSLAHTTQDFPIPENGYGFWVPTPRASMFRSRKWWLRRVPRGNLEELPCLQPRFAHLAGERINPEWLEWLMGWPIGWAGLEPLETAKVPLPLPSLSQSSTAA